MVYGLYGVRALIAVTSSLYELAGAVPAALNPLASKKPGASVSANISDCILAGILATAFISLVKTFFIEGFLRISSLKELFKLIAGKPTSATPMLL